MGEFFKGWRRKIGVVTLVLACVFAVDWMRLADYSVKEGRTSDVPWLPTVMHPQLGVPYGWIVLPLTLLSGYLLLSKPRLSKPKQTTEPAPTTGARHA